MDGAPTVPSVVSYGVPPDGRTLVGAAAAALRSSRPETTVHDSKRLIGLPANHSFALAEAQHLPYAVVPDPADARLCALQLSGLPGPPISPRAVATALLKLLKRAAERSRPLASALGFSFASATVSVPVGFTRAQRAETLAAGRAAGFRLVRLLEEPVAAAIAYGLHEKGGERTVLVYDMGGGTLDCALLRLDRSSRTFLVLATAGDARLGGEDFDRALAGWVRARAPAGWGGKGNVSAVDEARLLAAVEAAKRRLTRSPEGVTFELPGPGGFQFRLEAADAAAAVAGLLSRAAAPIGEVLERAALSAEEVDDVVLVGGASQLGAVRQVVAAAVGGRELHLGLDPDTAIAIGAARAYNC